MAKMNQATENKSSRAYQVAIIAVGMSLWFASAARVAVLYTPRQMMIILALVPVTLLVGTFSHTYKLPTGLRFSRNDVTFTFADSLVLLVICWFGIGPAIMVQGIEAFNSSRRIKKNPKNQLFSDLFSTGMMNIATACGGLALTIVLDYGFNVTTPVSFSSAPNFLAVSTALIVAALVQNVTNLGLLTSLFAMRERSSIGTKLKEYLIWTAPLFLPTGTVASLLYLAVHYNVLLTAVIAGPVFLAVYFAHRQYRNGVRQQMNIMEKAHRETIEALAVAINAKDEVTHEHVLRVQIYAAGVARMLGCNDQEVEALRAGALLHDIGKIAVPDYILNKPGKLTAAEFEKMKMHTIAGAQILGRVEFPYPIVPVVRHHHERWDGRGYPDGLSSENIPLTARILSVVDCFDAVREDRQYRRGLSRDEAIALIMEGSGTQYDPRVVGTFVANLPIFEAEIQAMRDKPRPTFGIEPVEQLSEAARSVAPAAGLAAADEAEDESLLSHKDLRSFHDLTQSVNQALGRNGVLEVFMQNLDKLIPFDTCAITLVAAGTGDNVSVGTSGELGHLLQGRVVTLGEGVTGWVIANQQPFCNTDPKLDFLPALAQHFTRYQTLAAFPIMKGNEMLGAVTLYSAELKEYQVEHQKLLRQATALLATALSAVSDEPVPVVSPAHPVQPTTVNRRANAMNQPGDRPVASLLMN
ncbi:MAG: HD domain-containing phosphohydrolase [Pyrinomonadaceae bacterium]